MSTDVDCCTHVRNKRSGKTIAACPKSAQRIQSQFCPAQTQADSHPDFSAAE